MRIHEKQLYPIVARWMKRKYKCFSTGINKGLRYSRIDVVGIRDVGGDLSGEVETISIEVKRNSEPFATSTGQASGYKVYANRIYLADFRKAGFTQDEIDIANHLGIGLIQITGRKKVCREILSSPRYAPLPRMQLLLFERLGVVKCQICDCYFSAGNKENFYANVTRANGMKTCKEGKGIMFWNFIVGKRKNTKPNSGFTTFERRFICPDCTHLMKDFTKAVYISEITKNGSVK